MPAWDYNLMFKSSGNLTKTSTVPAAGLIIFGTPVTGLGVKMLFPTSPGLSATVLPEVHVSEDDTTYYVAATYPGGAQSWASGSKILFMGFEVPQGKYKYVKLDLNITGGSTATSFGAVKAGLVLPGSGDPLDRTKNFS